LLDLFALLKKVRELRLGSLRPLFSFSALTMDNGDPSAA
jgi:hypothetical protein